MKTQYRRPFTVLVEGNIGCGKTTLLQHFSKFCDVEVLPEPVSKWRDLNGHNLLDLMYKDPERWSMPFQSYVQQTMLENHLQNTDRPVKLLERSIHSARYCFVENLYRTGKMTGSELEVLSHWFDFLVNSPELDLKIDLIVYLRTEPEKALERIRERNRGEETGIPVEYLEQLHQLHEDWLYGKKFNVPAPVITIDANQDMEDMIQEYKKHHDIIVGSSTREIREPPVSPQKILLEAPAAV
eukprot:TRINITY_DN3222_c0_g1_i1.p1 TRINITY_DN3222_c0_g1~~TRINITY_DN3222_c0_g1_i1.p1  ORF type:complete len:270 (+),score=43.62 TRINITY_DN3222_c0_g1_i1:88-810(+)